MNFPKQQRTPTGHPNYYSVRGWSRVSNRTFAGYCIILILFGFFLHFLSYRFSIFLRKIDVQYASQKNAERYAEIRKKADNLENWDEFISRLGSPQADSTDEDERMSS